MTEPRPAAPDARDRRDADAPHSIPRYRAATRINHWTVAIAFVLAALSGLALFHPALFWLTGLFGGGQWDRILHPFIGVVLALAFFSLALRVWGDNAMHARDWAWLKAWRTIVRNDEEAAPDVARYNGGQKLLFFVLVLCVLGLLATGLVIWRPVIAAYFPIGIVRIAALAHAVFAFAMVCSIVVHVYAGFWVKGSIHAMTQGNVTPGWAWKHHRIWFREMVGRPAPPPRDRIG